MAVADHKVAVAAAYNKIAEATGKRTPFKLEDKKAPQCLKLQ
jgi:hypothetical protein